MKKTGTTLKQLEEARRAKREQMEANAQMTLVEKERRRAEQEQQEQLQQRQREQIDKGVERYIDDLRQQIRSGTLPEEPSVFGQSNQVELFMHQQ